MPAPFPGHPGTWSVSLEQGWHFMNHPTLARVSGAGGVWSAQGSHVWGEEPVTS